MTLPSAPFGRETIESIIPHRPPFLLVDEVLELDDLVHDEERWPVRDDRLDRLPSERDSEIGHATSRFSSRSRRRLRPR